ncbi:hypothetical protein BDF22DRAFT_742749 [Syncephalis plumigaleata]|nr:hypothetical protein BDF22DRAFT_742749 [Syncephalis plumigaleata]
MKPPSDNHLPPKRPDEGRLAATRLFKLMNPELFIKPNRVIMTFGVISIIGLVGYFIRDNQLYREEKEREREMYRARLRQAQAQRAERETNHHAV